MSVSTPQEMPTEALRANPRNARTHPKKQIRQLARSIEQFGFTNPIIVDDNNIILAGHGRWQAAKHLERPLVPLSLIHI